MIQEELGQVLDNVANAENLEEYWQASVGDTFIINLLTNTLRKCGKLKIISY